MDTTSHSRVLSLLVTACALLGCNHPGAGADAAHNPATPAAAGLVHEATPPQPAPTAAAASSEVESYPLRRLGHRVDLVDAYADPSGTFVASADVGGNVRLWRVGDDPETVPVELPIREPAWLSVAAIDDATALTASIDTAGAATVWEVQVGPDAPQANVAFEIPPTDPLLEIHVLAGGERILALGIDHRIRIYDANGRQVGALDEPGFIPWQLRVRQSPGRPPELAAVLAHPVRIEALTLEGDELTHSGTAHRVVLDQSPNRNDLALTADGRTAVSLKRPRARGRTWAVELVDLKHGTRRVLAGKNRGNIRPRMHLLGDARLMLEDGEGRGTFYALTDAQPLTTPIEDVDLEDLPLANPLGARPLEHSDERTRMRSLVVGNTRVGVGGTHLVIDALDGEPHTKLDASRFSAKAVALSADSATVGWIAGDDVLLQGVDSEAPARVLASIPEATKLHWTPDNHLVVVDKHGLVRLLDSDDGSEIATLRVDLPWGPKSTRLAPGSGPDTSTLILVPFKKRARIREVRVAAQTLETVKDGKLSLQFQPAKSKPLTDWLEGLGHQSNVRADLRWLRTEASPQIAISRGWTPRVWLADKDHAPRSMRLHPGKVMEARLSNDGRLLAVLNVGFGWTPAHGESNVVVFDLETGRRTLSRPVGEDAVFAFSADGHGIAISDDRRSAVIDTATGEVALER